MNSIETAPKDGTTVRLLLPPQAVHAFWCDETKRWVTAREICINYVSNPIGWKPVNHG